jgi:hypothetical protein
VLTQQLEDRCRLSGVRMRRDQVGLVVVGNARRMREGIALLHERPAQDRLDDVRIEDVR